MKSKKYCEFGKAILKRLAELNMTQKELAEKMHCDRFQIYAYINGRHQPTAVTLMKLCLALDVDIADMMVSLEKDVQQNG